MAKDKEKQRDNDAHKVRKNIEERESRKQSKYRKPRHYEIDVTDDVDADEEEYMDFNF